MGIGIKPAALRLAICVLAAGTTLFGGNINFDDLATGTGAGGSIALSNQYLSQGVVFTNIWASKAFTFNILPVSTPNYASPFFFNLNPGSFQFVDPTTSAPAFVGSLSLRLLGLNADTHPGSFSGATIQGFDINGNAIAADTFVIPPTSVTDSDLTLSFVGAVHEVQFTIDTSNGLLPFDDMVFGPVTTPEPSTGLLLGGATLLLCAAMRARKLRLG